MSSLLNFFWSQPAASSEGNAAASAPSVAAPNDTLNATRTPAVSTPLCSSTPFADEFVLVDASSSCTPSAPSTPAATNHHARGGSWTVADAPQAMDEAPLKLAPASSPARSCRLYGAAHKAPRLFQPLKSEAMKQDSVTAESPAPRTPAGSKRSFAEILKASAGRGADSASGRVAYAQPAAISVAEQLLAKIEQLESLQLSTTVGGSTSGVHPARIVEDPLEESIESALDSISYSSPPLRPAPAPLNQHQMQLLYDTKTEWALNVDEPSAKRAKRTAPSSTIVALPRGEPALKGGRGVLGGKKSKPQQRVETKAVQRARVAKQEAEP